MSQVSSPARRSNHWLWPLLLLLGSSAMALAWMMAALATGTQAGWMAVLAALEVAWMLRLGGFKPGRARYLIAIAAVVVIAVVANWFIASAYIGGPMGLTPWESALRMGPRLAWTLLSLANGLGEAIWLAIGVIVAWRVGR